MLRVIPVSAMLCLWACSCFSQSVELCGYRKGANLLDTLAATRPAYRSWAAHQNTSVKAVGWSPWQVGLPGIAARLDPASRTDLTRKTGDGTPVWSAIPGWRDGKVVTLDAHCLGRHGTAFLASHVSAAEEMALTLGLGGGERLTVWLDGDQIATGETAIPYGRYGTAALWAEDTPADKLLVNLQLSPGSHTVVVALHQGAVNRSQPVRFYANPRLVPVHRVWAQIRRDFPVEKNALLEVADAAWFGADGWLVRSEPSLERALIARAIAEFPQAAEPLKRALAELAEATVADRRWLPLCSAAAELTLRLGDISRVRASVGALSRGFPRRYAGRTYLDRLAELEQRLLIQANAPCAEGFATAMRTLRDQIATLRANALVRHNPLLAGQTLLFVKRLTYNSSHYYDDYYNGVRDGYGFGGNIYACDLDSGAQRAVVPELEGGVFDRYDVSFDATRLTFGYRRPKAEGFRLWECGADGTGLRQLTKPPADEPKRIETYSYLPQAALAANPQAYGHWTDDLHPCYLPDGRIAFVSTRGERSVYCGGHSLTCTSLFRIERDGSALHNLSQGALSEFSPTMLADGRILYNRWEYIYKGIAAVQPLWTMRPDGSASEEVYGDDITDPGVLVHARQVPGREHLIVATACAHEPLAVGAIVLIDTRKTKRALAAMTSLTPTVTTSGLRGIHHLRNGHWRKHDFYGPLFCDPYPLADPETQAGSGEFFLVSGNPKGRYNDPKAYGIYLLDTFGNCVPVLEDPAFSCWQPMLHRPRPRPRVLPDMAVDTPEQATPQATLAVTDVYRGLDGVPRGTVKYLRIMEQIPRPWSVHQQWQPGDSIQGQYTAVSNHAHIWIAVMHGVVPVEADGSAYFQVPADRNIFLQALDEEFMEVQKMRTFVDFQPGERRSCIGCHERRKQAPQSRLGHAMSRPPSTAVPQPGDVAPRPLHYPTDVQPVFDQHCIRCHSGAQPKAGLDLSGELTTHFSRSYENLFVKGLVSFIQEWTSPPPERRGPGHVGGAMSFAAAAPPYSFGSHRSKLVDVLRKGHNGIKLPQADFVKLVTWIDANAPYYGSYFGRRHANQRKRPDFRPVPTLASACGQLPEPFAAEPVPATALANWAVGRDPLGVFADGSDRPLATTVVGATEGAGPGGRKAWQFDGRGYVETGGLGRPETVSVAMWVKAEQLPGRWNPLLFTNTPGDSAFHFSLLSAGPLNLAINQGDGQWVHRTGKTPLGLGEWRHVAVVCDPRYGGCVRFYIDGVLDASRRLEANVPLDLTAFRFGCYKPWQTNPDQNFHGRLADIRIHRGLLTPDEVAALASAPPAK